MRNKVLAGEGLSIWGFFCNIKVGFRARIIEQE